jgi:hypothetical protein
LECKKIEGELIVDPAKKVHGQIKSILGDKSEVVGVQGRDIVDIGSGVRAIASSLVGEVSIPHDKVTGVDGRSRRRVVLQDWILWKGGIKPGKDVCLPPILVWFNRADGVAPIIILHIQDAQVISPQVLSELIYIIWYVPPPLPLPR